MMIAEIQCDVAPGVVPEWEKVYVPPLTRTWRPQTIDLGDGEFATVRREPDGRWRILNLIVYDDAIPVELMPPLIQRPCRLNELAHVCRCLGVAPAQVIVDPGLAA